MTQTTFLLLISGVLLNATAQLALKATTRVTGPVTFQVDTLGSTVQALAAQPVLWVGLTCYGASILVWIAALSRVDVSVAYPMLSLGYVVTAIAAWWLFGEPLGPQRLLAIAIIIAGVYLLVHT